MRALLATGLAALSHDARVVRGSLSDLRAHAATALEALAAEVAAAVSRVAGAAAVRAPAHDAPQTGVVLEVRSTPVQHAAARAAGSAHAMAERSARRRPLHAPSATPFDSPQYYSHIGRAPPALYAASQPPPQEQHGPASHPAHARLVPRAPQRGLSYAGAASPTAAAAAAAAADVGAAGADDGAAAARGDRPKRRVRAVLALVTCGAAGQQRVALRDGTTIDATAGDAGVAVMAAAGSGGAPERLRLHRVLCGGAGDVAASVSAYSVKLARGAAAGVNGAVVIGGPEFAGARRACMRHVVLTRELHAPLAQRQCGWRWGPPGWVSWRGSRPRCLQRSARRCASCGV